jgi:biotin operon repressor
MSEPDPTAELLAFFKALADANRLKIVGLLAGGPHNVEQLAEKLGLSSSTVSHHLARLAEAGLVSGRTQGYYSIYQLETAALEGMARRLLSHDTLPAVAADVDVSAFERTVLNNFLGADGRFTTLPAQQKKYIVVLNYVVRAFEPGVRYPEKQVKEILSRFYDDTTSLRRSLIEFGLMTRENGVYWRVGDQLAIE